MRVIMIKGYSKTGKTTTVTALAKELRRRGYTVGTVKDIHYEGYRADAPGKDTWKHREAGACRVTARGPADTAVIVDQRMDVHEILKYYKEDFVILEGDCGLSCPTIVTGRTPEDVAARMCPEAVAISGIIARKMREYHGLPVIDGITEVEKLAELVEEKTREQQQKPEVELFIGGEEIWMVPFVKETVKNVVVGAVKALDGYEEGKEIVIKVK